VSALSSSDRSLRIRALQISDHEGVRELDFQTGLLGDSMAKILDHRRLFDRALDPYLMGDGAGIVAEQEGRMVGYAVATIRDPTFSSAAATLRGFMDAASHWRSLSLKDRHYVRERSRAMLLALPGPERRFRAPRGARLHINLIPESRGSGIGSRLLGALAAELRSRGVFRVHANSYQSPGNPTHLFWLANGFVEYSRVRSNAWRAFGIDEEIELVCYVKNLGQPDR
jgi:GNAT superfamily N-acetyltransferase